VSSGRASSPLSCLRAKVPIAAGITAFFLSFVLLLAIFKVGFNQGLLQASVMAIVLGMVSAGPFSRTLQETHADQRQADGDSHLFIEVMTMEISAVLLFAFISSPSSLSSASSAALYSAKMISVIMGTMVFGLFLAKPLITRLEGYLRTRRRAFP